jgi:hypothetical protein
MKAFHKKFKYDGGMDAEVLDLCNAMNALPGIETLESCCGHSAGPFMIFFRIKDTQEGLFFLTRCVDRRYWKYGYLWKIELSVGDMMHDDLDLVFKDYALPITFLLHSGPIVGEDAYAQAKDLVENMNHHINLSGFMDGFGLDVNHFDVEKVTLTI